MAKRIKSGTIKHSSEVDLLADNMTKLVHKGQTPETGYYVYFGMWKGPFATKQIAADCYREWATEAKFS